MSFEQRESSFFRSPLEQTRLVFGPRVGLGYRNATRRPLAEITHNHLKFESLAQVLAKLPVKNAILDGEVVCLDEHGVSQFRQLLRHEGDPVFYAFDLLWLNGKDCRRLPLLERKHRLELLLKSSKSDQILYAQHVAEYGKQFFAQICSHDLEGIIAKRKLGSYKDSARNWLKIKNSNYSQGKGRHDMLTHTK